MRTSAFMAGEDFARLRRRIAQIEANAWVKPREDSTSEPRLTPPPEREVLVRGQAHVPASRAPPSLAPRRAGTALPFTIPQLDKLLAGGLRRAALHEMHCDESRDAAAMTGFAAAVLARLAAEDNRPILWIVEAAAVSEAGFPYGAGLARFGLDPARIIVVRVTRPQDALWVFEEGLRCRGLAAVLTEIRGAPRLLDLTASRRLAMRAAEHGVMGLLLRQSNRTPPGAANTRWLVAPLPASMDDDFPEGIGHPAWRLTLERNRQGATGIFDLEWDHERRCFAPARTAAAPAHSLPLPPLPLDRPPAPPDAGKVVAINPPHGEILPREEKRRRQWARG